MANEGIHGEVVDELTLVPARTAEPTGTQPSLPGPSRGIAIRGPVVEAPSLRVRDVVWPARDDTRVVGVIRGAEHVRAATTAGLR